MIKDKTGESLVGIVIGVFILSFVILGIANLLIQNTTIVHNYENKRDMAILQTNTSNIIKNIDTSKIKEGEIFFLYKNSSSKTFEVFTGASNAGYKYIDRLGNKIDNLSTYEGRIYSRVLWVERDDNSTGQQHQIIKASIRRLIKG